MAATLSPLGDLTGTSARPVLASALLQAALARYQREGPERRFVLSGCGELDEYVLLGGLERGGVVGVSGDLEEGVGRILSLHILITCLMSNPAAKASIIDTTGSFPISLLAKIIEYRLKPRPGVRGIRRLEAEDEVNQKVQEILERVSISRVFDIDGVWEVLSEISRDCHVQARGLGSVEREVVEGEKEEVSILPRESSLGVYPPTNDHDPEIVVPRQEKEIFDSQDEDDDELNIDPEVEEAITMTQESLKKPKDAPEPCGIQSTPEAESPDSMKELRKTGTTEIIIVDNMTTCIGDLFSKRERTSAHALLQALSRTLSTISQTNSILTLLLNSIIDPHKSYPLTNHNHSTTTTSSKPTPSVFSSTASRPAFGRIFDNFVSLHLMISKIPKTARDAAIFYDPPPPTLQAPSDDEPNSHTALQPAVQHAHIIEVLKDAVPDLEAWLDHTNANSASRGPRGQRRPRARRRRRRRRTQRWAPFVVSSDGLTLLDAFPALVAGNRGRGTRSGAVAAPGRQDMHIVKQFPFGRRA